VYSKAAPGPPRAAGGTPGLADIANTLEAEQNVLVSGVFNRTASRVTQYRARYFKVIIIIISYLYRFFDFWLS